MWGGWVLLGLFAGPSYPQLCGPCHGDEGRGDGPAHTLYWPPPADLTGPFKLGDHPEAIARTLRLGIPGTGMPSFGALSEAERGVLVAEVLELRRKSARGEAGRTAIRAEPKRPPAPIETDPYFAPPRVVASRPPPPAQPPILRAAAADQCGRCHPAIYEAWSHSRHARAWGPGVVGQAVGRDTRWLDRCSTCHAPADRSEAVGCVGCHVRDHQKRGLGSGSEGTPASLRAEPDPRFGRSDFCLPCHNQAAGPGERPLLDTWREWAASPYLPAGIQCQHCHVPGGDHRFSGAHDRDAVRRAVRLAAEVRAPFEVVVRLENVGAGHAFPTTPTPRGVVRVRQFAAGRPLPTTERTWAIGRTLAIGGLREVADTRIPPGGARQVVYRVPRAAGADAVEVDLSFFPDWHYTGVFRRALADARTPPGARSAYAEALQEAETSGFLVHMRRLVLP